MEIFRSVVLWLHIVGAVMAIGGVFFLRIVLMPIVKRDGCEHAPALSDKVRAKFRKLIWHSIATLLVTGAIMLWFMLRAPTVAATTINIPNVVNKEVSIQAQSEWKSHSPRNRQLLETKIMLALALFGIALYLTLPAQASDELRAKAPKLLLVNLALGMVILFLVALRHVYP